MSKRTILLVEDSVIQATSIAEMLEQLDFAVIIAEDGEAAAKVLEDSPVDLILADGRMPNMDGYELCSRVRAHPRLAELPYVLMTVYDEAENALRGLKCGADLFLAKPLDPELLKMRLERLLETPRRPFDPDEEGTVTTWFRDRPVEVHLDPGRAVDYLACALEDVERARRREYEEHRKAEEALAARDFLQAALDTFPAEIAVVDGRSVVLKTNKSWHEAVAGEEGSMGGAEVEDNLLEKLAKGSLDEAGMVVATSIEEVLNGSRPQFEFEFPVDRDGERRWYVVLVNRFEGEGPVRAMVVRKEITGRKTVDEQLRLAQKMEAVGTLTAGVAHEINNPLTYVMGHVESLIAELGQGPHSDDLEGIQEGLTRIREIVAKLKVFSHGETVVKPRLVNLGEVVEGAARMVANEIRFRARLELDIPDDLPGVVGREGELGQVALNLLVNAAHAIAEGDVEGNVVRVHIEEKDSWVLLHVEDSGMGIPADVIPRLFNPFFTTKAPGEGTGLGLSICDGIVRSCGGHFEVKSTPGEGSCFTVFLPAAREEPAAEEEAAESGPGEEVPRGRILVVDDEPRLCDMVQRLLQNEHEVLLAGAGRRAQEILTMDRDFDLILCDMMMPDLSGMELLDWVKEEWPDLVGRMVFMSGGAFTEKARRFQEEAGGLILEKPFSSTRLHQVVRQKLRERPPQEA